MKIKNKILDNFSQILALTEKNLFLEVRFKLRVFISFLLPLISILMPLIIMGQFLEYNDQFGSWTEKNFVLYQLLAYNIILLQKIMLDFPAHLHREKYWKTLPALLIGPFNRINLLFGIVLSHLLLISLPFCFFFILSYIYSPISLDTVLVIIGVFFLIALLFSGIGLLIGIFAVSNENIWKGLSVIINLVFWLSCVTYPFELFPNTIQNIINLNPLYYIFDFLRFVWIENEPIFSIITHLFHFFILIGCSIIIPFIGVFIFNRIYQKYGIVGY